MAKDKIRFAVVGLGHIAQAAVLPAFAHAKELCELTALVSSDADKLAELGDHYGVEHRGSYDELERVLRDGEVDAAYVALPNMQHRAYTERCARAGVHVLCEKPMAMSTVGAEAMLLACDENDVKLMIAYRLQFEPANLRAIEIAQSGALGELRYFSSCFSHRVEGGNIRNDAELGGGALFDLGIYGINAARNLFRAEPEEVFAIRRESRARGVDESTTAILRFPGDRVAQITASQGAADVDELRIVGTRGDLRVEPAFTYVEPRAHHLTIEGKRSEKTFGRSDQFAPELLYFARCILDDSEPVPSGIEGLADVRVLEAIAESTRIQVPVQLAAFARSKRPGRELEIVRPAVRRPHLVDVDAPSK